MGHGQSLTSSQSLGHAKVGPTAYQTMWSEETNTLMVENVIFNRYSKTSGSRKSLIAIVVKSISSLKKTHQLPLNRYQIEN